jgi:hypothetical protein
MPAYFAISFFAVFFFLCFFFMVAMVVILFRCLLSAGGLAKLGGFRFLGLAPLP